MVGWNWPQAVVKMAMDYAGRPVWFMRMAGLPTVKNARMD